MSIAACTEAPEPAIVNAPAGRTKHPCGGGKKGEKNGVERFRSVSAWVVDTPPLGLETFVKLVTDTFHGVDEGPDGGNETLACWFEDRKLPRACGPGPAPLPPSELHEFAGVPCA